MIYIKIDSIIFFFFIKLLLLTGCTNSVSEPFTSGQWQGPQLSNTRINTLYLRNNNLFVGTGSGIYKHGINESNPEWNSLGLRSDTTEVVDIIAWDSQEIMAAVKYDEYHPDNVVLLKSVDGGNDWQSFNDQFVGENINNFLTHLAMDLRTPNKIFAQGGLPIARSNDRGVSWSAVYKTWELAAFGKFLKIDSGNTEIVWAGGATNIFTPALVKSTDGGDSWERLEPAKVGVEATVWDISISANNSDHVIIGLSGIRRSSDGGQTWQTIFEDASIRTFSQSVTNPKIVYASGINQQGTLFFAASDNFGGTWQTVEFTNGPTGIQVNDMVSVMGDGNEVLYFGTNKGVYSYVFEE